MFNHHKVEIEWGGRPLILETGKIARQADGAVLATYGETVVLATVVSAKSPKPGQDFFPLTVHYQEKYSAAGRIPGGFFKRERGATEKETLVSRLIDRPIRPLFVKGFKNETQVVITVLQHDMENDPDVLGMVAASAALTISGVPFMGPIGAARVGYVDGEYILNPTDAQVAEGDLDLVVAATYDAVMMVESEANELSEEIMLGAVLFAHDACKEVVKAIVKLAEQAAKDPWEVASSDDNAGIKDKLKKLIGKDIAAAYKLTDKSARSNALNEARAAAKAAFADAAPQDQMAAGKLMKKLEAEIVRGAILKDGKVVFAVAEERLNRRKHYGGVPVLAIQACLDAVGAKLSDVEHVAIGRDNDSNLGAKMRYALSNPAKLPRRPQDRPQGLRLASPPLVLGE